MVTALQETAISAAFAVHLLCVNVAAGGPLLCAWLEWREGRGEISAGRAADFLTKAALGGFLLGGALGAGLIFVVWSPDQRSELLRVMSNKIGWGLAELVFYLATLVGYWLWRRSRARGWERFARGTLVAAAGTNLLYHFPALFVVLSHLSHHRLSPTEPIGPGGFRALLAEPTILSQCVHYWLASLAVAGAALLAFPLWPQKSAEDDAIGAARPAVWGARLALTLSLAQIPVGIWALMSLPARSSTRLMGGDWAATALLALALAAALGLLHQLAAVALGETQRRRLLGTLALMALTVALMAAMLRQSRPERSIMGESQSSASQKQARTAFP